LDGFERLEVTDLPPMLRTEPALPMLNIEPALPILRMDPTLPMLRIEPALPMQSTLPKLKRLPTLRALRRESGLRALRLVGTKPVWFTRLLTGSNVIFTRTSFSFDGYFARTAWPKHL